MIIISTAHHFIAVLIIWPKSLDHDVRKMFLLLYFLGTKWKFMTWKCLRGTITTKLKEVSNKYIPTRCGLYKKYKR